MYEFHANVVSVYDGDTITVDIDLGLNCWIKNQKLRLVGIDTPEVRGPQKPEGLIVRDWSREQISGKKIIIKTHKSRNKGKYGRWLCAIFIDGRDLIDEMIEAKMGKEYWGGKR